MRSMHSLDSISVHGLFIWTHNDQEGYHSRLGNIAVLKSNLYALIDILYEESRKVKITAYLVSLGKFIATDKRRFVEYIYVFDFINF